MGGKLKLTLVGCSDPRHRTPDPHHPPGPLPHARRTLYIVRSQFDKGTAQSGVPDAPFPAVLRAREQALPTTPPMRPTSRRYRLWPPSKEPLSRARSAAILGVSARPVRGARMTPSLSRRTVLAASSAATLPLSRGAPTASAPRWRRSPLPERGNGFLGQGAATRRST